MIRDNTDLIEKEGEPLSDDLEKRAMQLYERSEMLEIDSNDAYAAGVETLKRLKRTRESWKELNRKPIAAAKLALDEAKALFKKIDEPLADGYDSLKDRCEGFLTKQREAQRAIAAAPTPVMPPPPPPGSSIADAFDAAVEAGDTAKAEHLLREADRRAAQPPPVPILPAPAPPPWATTMAPKVDGAAVANSWTFDIFDETLIPDGYRATCRECGGLGTVLDRKSIASVVKAMKDRTNIPGVQARPDTSLRVRT